MYELFLNQTMDAVNEMLKEDYSVILKKVPKNNGVILDGFTFVSQKSPLAVSPTIYTGLYFEQHKAGRNIDDIAKEIVTDFLQHTNLSFDVSSFKDFNKAKGKICYKLINTKLNEKLLQNIPNRQFHDLSIVYYLYVDNFDQGAGSVLIYNDHLSYWNVKENDLFTLAAKNTKELFPASIHSMSDVLAELMPGIDISEIPCDNFMYVISNHRRIFGDAVILYPDALDALAKRLNCNLWLLPSSVHEWIVLPANIPMNKEHLTEMIQEVNASQVEAQEILGNYPYYFDRETSLISM